MIDNVKDVPLYEIHQEYHAKFTEFSGYRMPLYYESIRNEHIHVRTSVGLFDLSHMGVFMVKGPESFNLIQNIITNDLEKISVGKAQYTLMCDKKGGVIDDLIVYILDKDIYMLVVNASNKSSDLLWIQKNNSFNAVIEDISFKTTILALQGPESTNVIKKILGDDIAEMTAFSVQKFKYNMVEGYIATTGYTGERGYEIYYYTHDKKLLSILWRDIMDSGNTIIKPIGLGARDSLRLEKGYMLYGNDIDINTNPYEARLGWVISKHKHDYIGKDELINKKSNINHKLCGILMDDRRGIPRKNNDITCDNNTNIGRVTSGGVSFSLNKNIALGYIKIDHADIGNKVYVNVRNRYLVGTIVKLPFV